MAGESAIQRLREANPVTDPTGLVEEHVDAHLFLAAIKQRSVAMRADFDLPEVEQDGSESYTEIDVVMTDDPSRRPRTALLVGAAFALIVLLAGALALLNRETETDVASDLVPTTTAEPAAAGSEEAVFGAESASAVVDDYFAAFNGGDVDSLLALFTDDATFSSNLTVPSDELRLVWSLAQGSTLTTPECAPTDVVAGSAVTVACEFGTLQAPGSAVDAPPVSTTAKMTITPSGISHLEEFYPFPHFTTVGGPFEQWMEENHPEDADAAGCCQGDTVEESVARGELRAQYAAEWAAYLEANDCTFTEPC